MSETPAAPLIGAALIKDEVRRLPDRPGVYRMIGEDGEVLYVGKARSLKKRVIQYAQGRFHTQRIAHMVDLTRAMVFVTTRTETDALLLEINLIKQLKPRFNVLLRDDKSFPEIVIRREHPAAQLKKHRGAHSIKGDYFGPFASAHSVTKTLNTLQKAFLLRSCSDSVYESRTRPCMLHQIKRCSAPCTGLVSLDDYAGLVEQAEAFLRGKSRAVMQRLSEDMQTASDDMEFELAARLRDRIRALASVAQETQINPETLEEADVFALHAEGGQACVQVFFFRAGQNWGNRAYFPRVDKSDEDADIMGAFIGQFYDDKPIPKLVLVSVTPAEDALLAEAFALKSGRKVEISRPQRGEKRQLVDHALTNAREALGRKMAESSAQTRLLSGVADAFGLEAPPERIEVYDNSHIMGTNAVGGMIVAGPDGFQKSQYRKFNIKDSEITPGDDFGMMKEVLRRRFARMVKEEEDGLAAGESSFSRPDLVLVDGGLGQLGAALEIMAELGMWSGWPRAQTATPGWNASSSPANRRSCSSRNRRFCTTSNACATKPTASPSAPTGRSVQWT
jgi:excinuclease ABC subunit C